MMAPFPPSDAAAVLADHNSAARRRSDLPLERGDEPRRGRLRQAQLPARGREAPGARDPDEQAKRGQTIAHASCELCCRDAAIDRQDRAVHGVSAGPGPTTFTRMLSLARSSAGASSLSTASATSAPESASIVTPHLAEESTLAELGDELVPGLVVATAKDNPGAPPDELQRCGSTNAARGRS